MELEPMEAKHCTNRAAAFFVSSALRVTATDRVFPCSCSLVFLFMPSGIDVTMEMASGARRWASMRCARRIATESSAGCWLSRKKTLSTPPTYLRFLLLECDDPQVCYRRRRSETEAVRAIQAPQYAKAYARKAKAQARLGDSEGAIQ
eukprot:2714361-Rhodomonas_salina.1